MRPRHIVIAALACGLTAVNLAVPAPAAHAEPVKDAPAAGVPAVDLLVGPAPMTVTVTAMPTGPVVAVSGAALLLHTVGCEATTPVAGTDRGHASQPGPCPTPAEWTDPATFAIVKQPHPSVDQHATPAVGPSAPSLLLLDHLRPRSALPDSRTTHLDPRPA